MNHRFDYLSTRLTPTQVEEADRGKGNRLEVSHPDAQIWMVRIGSRHVRQYHSLCKYQDVNQ